jgi:cellobiose-specific phosphotransferase system component IIC
MEEEAKEMHLSEKARESSSSSSSGWLNRVKRSEFMGESTIILRNAFPLVICLFIWASFFSSLYLINFTQLWKQKALGNLSQMCFTIMSLFFCGHIGTQHLAAVSLANTV